jgi:7-cyano-7-deazaguanine synthase
MNPKAVVLLSGGLDSATCLAIAGAEGFEPHALSFDYGQRHRHELEAAARVASAMGAARHVVVKIDLRQWGGSALTEDALAVPKHDSADQIGQGNPITYVPARNTIFLAYATAWAEVLGAHDVYIGVNALDYSGYPDCRPEFIEAFQKMANLATRSGVQDQARLTVHAPLIRMSKRQIVERGLELGVDYAMTHSCYDPGPDGLACGRCDSCLLRRRGFEQAGLVDPLPYRDAPTPPRAQAIEKGEQKGLESEA